MTKFKFVLNIKTNIILLEITKKRLTKQFRQKKSNRNRYRIVWKTFKYRINIL